MFDALDITEEEAQGLAEIAQHDLALARDFARRAQAAEDSDEANRLARSYQRAARSYRQTLALKARLKRDLAAAAQAEAATPRPKSGGAAVARRVGELREALMRLSWDEAERPEAEGETVEFDAAARYFIGRRADVLAVIEEAREDEDFCDEPLDDHVARVALGLDFDPDDIARWRDLPDPPQAAFDYEPDDDDDEEWDSS